MKTFITLLALSGAALLVNLSANAAVERVDEKDLFATPDMGKTIEGVLGITNQYHYRPMALDDQLSGNLLDRYLESLDPTKIYFSADDIANYERYRSRLDDSLKNLDVSPAFEIFKTFRLRADQRAAYATSALASEFDFTKPESLPIRSDESAWFETITELENYWHQRVKNDILNLKLSETQAEEILELLTARYQRQADRVHQMVADDVFEIFMNAYSLEVEPHTSYFSKRSAENFRIRLSLSLEGIGAALETDLDYVVVNRVIAGGPADESNEIHAEDRIVGVGQGALDGGETEDMINVIGWRLMDVVDMIRGPKGSTVRLEILPKDTPPGSAPELVELVRDKIKLEEQAAKRSDIEIQGESGTRKMAVISIPSFYSDFDARAANEKDYRSSTRDVRNLLDDIEPGSVDGIIIDLRNNGGGSLDEATSLTGLFVKSGPIVQIRSSDKKIAIKRDPDRGIVYDGPLAVLVNRYSASASEIFAGAIQDYGRGLIIGERTYGKGTVQQLIDLSQVLREDEELGQFKFTTAQFFRISGNSTQNRGVEPDIELNLGESDEEFGEQALENALPWALIKPARYDGNPIITSNNQQLTTRHIARTQSDSAFIYLRNSNAASQKSRDLEMLSLVESTRVLERESSEQEGLARLNAYRHSLNLEDVTLENMGEEENELPGGDEHWNIVIHKEASRILLDSLLYAKLTADTSHELNQGAPQN
ncbi:MAG: carboxy terminal-processing peptidase [Proteobacteria bacterium]|nr:carboxy terminal-processing peptidase [Pseudomonadota bacterium]